MVQVFPHHGLFAEHLLDLSMTTNSETAYAITHLVGFRFIVLRKHMETFDANRRAIVGCLVHITETPFGEGDGTDVEKFQREGVG